MLSEDSLSEQTQLAMSYMASSSEHLSSQILAWSTTVDTPQQAISNDIVLPRDAGNGVVKLL